jgi:hypothetical protein
MSELDVDAIRARADAATPGPWATDPSQCEVLINTPDYRTLVLLGDHDTRELHPQADADATFLAAAREDIPALLDEVERLRANWHQIEQMFADAARSVDESVRAEQRLRSELRDARNDLLDVRGLLSPNGGDSVLPDDMADIGERVAPAVEWLIGEVERLHTWAGLMSLLDEHYPASVFHGDEDREERDRDPGARLISLIRQLDQVRNELEQLRDYVKIRRAVEAAHG